MGGRGVGGRISTAAFDPTHRDGVMSHICLANGRRFDYDDKSTWDNLTPEVIAWSLSGLNRFLNHSGLSVNVAEHSVTVSYLVPPEDALAALLHDATEAVTGDIPKPFKDRPECAALRAFEVELLAHILTKHGLAPTLSDAVHAADRLAFQGEVFAVMPNTSAEMWGFTPERVHLTTFGSTATQARLCWMGRYKELTHGSV